MDLLIDWLESLEWQRLIPEILGKGLGFLAGFAASWYLLFRRRLNALQRLQSGDSDDFIFQMHCLQPIPERPDEAVLLFRNLAPKTTLHDLYDNLAARELVKNLADKTSLGDPILKTEGTLGFEILNDAMGHIAGWLAVTPFEMRNVALYDDLRGPTGGAEKMCTLLPHPAGRPGSVCRLGLVPG